MKKATWNETQDFLGAGNLIKTMISDDFTSVEVNAFYGDGQETEIDLVIVCNGLVYFDLRQDADHEPGSGIILEANLYKSSSLLDQLKNHQLDRNGGLFSQKNDLEIYHMEIIGEITINIICNSISFFQASKTS